MGPRTYLHQTKYMRVAANTTDDSGGIVVPAGETIGIYRFRANGADPAAYVTLIWDHGGVDEFVIGSTKGDIDLEFDVTLDDYQFVGDGVKKMNIVIINDNSVESPYIGGSWESVKI